ncbi:MAG: hypothetical protein WCI22_16170, partial [Actinomycetota bacterium]
MIAPKPMVKSTAPVAHLTTKPKLTLVPRRRRTARLVAAGSAVVFGLMIGAAAFQTQVARRQVRLDTMDGQIRDARTQYDVLRRTRAELRSPGRLAMEATSLGMEPATQTQFITLDPKVLAEVQRTGLRPEHTKALTIDDEFATYAHVKAQAGG